MSPGDFVGTPYSHLNCYQLVRECSSKCYGVELPEVHDYLTNSAAVISCEIATRDGWDRVDYNSRQPGDVITLSAKPDRAAHVGIAIDNGLVLHNDLRYGAMIQTDRGLECRGYAYRNAYRWRHNDVNNSN